MASAATAKQDKVTVDLTTAVGTLCFPHLFKPTQNDRGEDVYDVQILIPKSDTAAAREILKAIKTVGVAKWGDPQWKKHRNPLRDGDAEKDDVLDDGKTKGEKYPERLGHWFLNARSNKPVAVVDRARVPITESSDVYGGCKGKIAVTFYTYATKGNVGIGCGLNGVQKIADGEPFGGGAPPVESMFDMLPEDPDEDFGLDDEPKKGKGKTKSKKAEPEPEPEPKKGKGKGKGKKKKDAFDDLD